MTIDNFWVHQPKLAPSAYIAKTAVIIGQVHIGEDSSVWPMTVLRGDVNSIYIGNRTNIQDGTIIHVNHAGPFNQKGDSVIIGDEVTIGHRVTLHGCQIADHCLIGIGAIIMDRVLIEAEVVVAAGTLVPPGKTLTGGYLWLGAPAKKIRPLTKEEKLHLRYSADYYVKLQKQYVD